MTAALNAPPQDGWTPEDVDALPDSIAHLAEIVDGSLIVSPAPSAWHNDVIREVANALVAAATDGLWAYGDTEIRRIDPDGLIRQRPIPDVLVAPRALRDQRSYAVPDEVRLVVEVVSPNSVRRDRLEKPVTYAQLCIPHLWRIERGVTLVEYHLRPDGAMEIVQSTTGGIFRTAAPFPVEIDLDHLR